MDEYLTLPSEHRHEPAKVKGSRFIATLVPVTDLEAVETTLARLRRQFHDATHNCFAYRLGRNARIFRFSDDGEPSGSAGRPILMQIDGRGLTDCLVVVTRYFGGTKLGVGGLVRAYGGAAGEGLDALGVKRVRITRSVVLRFPYELTSAVNAFMARLGVEPVSAAYEEAVVLRFAVSPGDVDSFAAQLRDVTGGRSVVQIEE